MDKVLQRPVFLALILAAICGYIFFFDLGGIALTDPDETFYAQTAKEMLLRHEWHTPYLYDKPQFEKPILFYWLVEASFKAFGVNEFAARFPSAVFAALGVLGIYLLGSILFNKRVGVFAALIMATNVEYIILSRACVTDMVLNTLLIFGLLFFSLGYLKEKRYFYLLSAVFFALATLTKGPVFIVLPVAAFILFLILAKDFKGFKKIPIFWCIVVFLVVAMPWYILIYKIHGKAFIDSFFGFHNINRFLESEHKIGSQVLYNVPIALAGFFPWSVFLPLGFWHIFKKTFSKDHKEKKPSLLILIWFFIVFLFFTASATKLPTYIFPCFTSLALIAALFLENSLKNNAPQILVKQMKGSYYFLLAAVALTAIGLPVFIMVDYPAIFTGVFVATIFFSLGMIFSFAMFINKKFIAAGLFIVYAVAILLYPLDKLILPEMEHYETSKEISEKLLPMMKPGDRLGAESNYLAGLAFYTGKIPKDVDKHDTVVRFLNNPGRAWCVIKPKNHRHLHELDTKPYYMKPTYRVYEVGKRAIVTNLAPDDGKYILKLQRTQ